MSQLLSERESSRKSTDAVVKGPVMVRYAPLVSKRPKPPQVLGRKRAASALSATTECLPAAAEML